MVDLAEATSESRVADQLQLHPARGRSLSPVSPSPGNTASDEATSLRCAFRHTSIHFRNHLSYTSKAEPPTLRPVSSEFTTGDHFRRRYPSPLTSPDGGQMRARVRRARCASCLQCHPLTKPALSCHTHPEGTNPLRPAHLTPTRPSQAFFGLSTLTLSRNDPHSMCPTPILFAPRPFPISADHFLFRPTIPDGQEDFKMPWTIPEWQGTHPGWPFPSRMVCRSKKWSAEIRGGGTTPILEWSRRSEIALRASGVGPTQCRNVKHAWREMADACWEAVNA